MGAPEIGNAIGEKNIRYTCPPDERVPRKSLSLKDVYKAASGVLGRGFLAQFEMYRLLAFPSSVYDEVGETRSVYDQAQTTV